jgi:two-component system, cell cycle response regulator
MPRNLKKEDSDDTLYNASKESIVSLNNDEKDTFFLGKSLYVPILVVLDGESVGQRFILNKSETIIGRRENNEICFFDNLISRNHSKITIALTKEGSVEFSAVIEDLESMNGTYVNGVKIQGPYVLKDGDKITIGSFHLGYFIKLRDEINLDDHLLALAQKDFLTSLYNRAYFIPTLEFEFKRFKRYKHPLSLIIFDIDFFKKVNDTYGHNAGDYVLKEIANLLRQAVRSCDLAVRYGGEEFAVLLIRTPIEEAIIIAERIRTVIKKHPFKFEDKAFSITSSFGVAHASNKLQSAQELLAKADEALYTAKNSGRDNVQMWKDTK